MPELTFKSAGVSSREIDLSGPTTAGPVGTPAGAVVAEVNASTAVWNVRINGIARKILLA